MTFFHSLAHRAPGVTTYSPRHPLTVGVLAVLLSACAASTTGTTLLQDEVRPHSAFAWQVGPAPALHIVGQVRSIEPFTSVLTAVVVYDSSGAQLGPPVTARDGHFSVAVPSPGKYSVWVRAVGLAEVTGIVRVPSDSAVLFVAVMAVDSARTFRNP
jgi:hypothetical protein